MMQYLSALPFTEWALCFHSRQRTIGSIAADQVFVMNIATVSRLNIHILTHIGSTKKDT